MNIRGYSNLSAVRMRIQSKFFYFVSEEIRRIEYEHFYSQNI